MSKHKITVERCENPTCSNEAEVVPGEVTPGVAVGRGVYYDGFVGGPLPAIYACSVECLSPAVQAAIEKARQ